MTEPLSPYVLRVRDLMSSPVATLQPDADLATAESIMKLAHLRHLPVVSHGRLVGLLSHRDLLHAHLSSTVQLSPREGVALTRRVLASTVMRHEVRTTHPDALVAEVARTMVDHKIGCLPVLEGERLVGIITEADLVAFLARVLEHLDPRTTT